MIIKDAKLLDIESITILHKNTLVSPGSSIGKPYLKRLYKVILSFPEFHVCLKAMKDDQIVGIVTSTKNLERTNNLLKKILTFNFLAATVWTIILGRVGIGKLLNRLIFEKTVLRKYQKPYTTILTMFVDRKYQKQGIGKKLTRTLMQKLKQDKIKKIHVDTYLKNQRAIKFYKAFGFKEIDHITDSLVMEYDIS